MTYRTNQAKMEDKPGRARVVARPCRHLPRTKVNCMTMQSVPPAPPQSSMRAMTLRLWWLFPLGWAVVYCIGLALATLALYASHSERLEGWSGIGLGVILLGILVLYVLLTWGWLYSKPPISVRLGLLIF